MSNLRMLYLKQGKMNEVEDWGKQVKKLNAAQVVVDQVAWSRLVTWLALHDLFLSHCLQPAHREAHREGGALVQSADATYFTAVSLYDFA